jgi:catechol 2,3-dioxygenase-like lactoylglutathione lyase family enzyme
MSVQALSAVELPVADLDRAVAWYADHLGLAETWRGDGQALLAVAGQAHPGLFLVETEDPARLAFTRTANGRRHSVVDFLVGDLPALHAALTAAGVDADPLEPDGFGFGFRDADGNSLGAHRAPSARS